jgi:polysaccharide biosynthesis protein PslG
MAAKDSLVRLPVIGAALVCALCAQGAGPAATGGASGPPPGGERRPGVETHASYDMTRYPFGLHVISRDPAGPAEIGARWTREAVMWKEIEPVKGQTRDFGRVVPRFNELTAAGFEILPRFMSVNPWAEEERINRLNAAAAGKRAPMGATTYLGMPTDLAAYRRFLSTVVEAFDGDGSGDVPGLEKGIRYWQVENEWDWRWKDTPQRLVEFLKVAYETIKAADPGATVVLGGISKLAPDAFQAGLLGEAYEINGKVITPETLAQQEHFREEHPLRTYVLEHAYPYFDIISFHQYGLPQAIDKEVEYLRGIMRARGYEKPLWMTEAGGPFVPYGEAYTEDRQAQEVVKYYVSALASGVEVIFWSTYMPTPSWGTAFTNTALLDARGRKKPAYETYKLMTSKLGDATRVESLFTAPRGRLVRFTRKARPPVFVGWAGAGPGGRAPGAGAPALDRLRALLGGKLEGKSLEVTWYDGTVRTVRDIEGEMGGLLGKGPAFIEVR